MRAAVALPTDLMVQRAMPVPTTRALRMVQVLRAKGAEVHMVEWLRWPNDLPARETRDGIRYRRFALPVPSGGLATRALFLRRLNATVRDALLDVRPDGIVLQDEELMMACMAAARRLRVPFFYDSQEHWLGMVERERPLEARLYRLQQRRAARVLTHVYTAVEATAEDWRRRGVEATTIFNSRDAAEIRPFEIPREKAKALLGLGPDTFVLGFLGSVSPEQGLEPVLEALAGLPPEVRVVVVGGPPEQLARLEARARELGVRDRLLTHPPVPPEEVVRLNCAFDVGLLTLHGSGPNFAYRLSYKFFDYMALGLPSIVSDYPELRRVGVREAGFCVPAKPGDAAAIREAALRLHRDARLREALGRRGREAFDRVYSGERQKERLRASHAFWR